MNAAPLMPRLYSVVTILQLFLAGNSHVQIATVSVAYEERARNTFIRIIYFTMIAVELLQKYCRRTHISHVKENKVAHLRQHLSLFWLFSCGGPV